MAPSRLPPDKDNPPGGIAQLDQSKKPASTVTSSGMGGSDARPGESKMRTFEQIIAEEKDNRNILEVKITRLQIEEDGVQKPAKPLSLDDVSVLIFDVIGVKPQDCLGVALYTSRFDTKEIKMKPGVDPSPYLTRDKPISFKNHEIVVTSQTANVTQITFKNVPFNIPDEEILNLCSCYGEVVDHKVTYERPSLLSRGVKGSTRYVSMNLTPGKQFENFYWLEGPLDGDKGARITVLHTGQEKQCSHCLKRESDCAGAGVGKVCSQLGTARGLMGDYMRHLYLQHNYMSLKMKYNQVQFPLLGSRAHANDGFGHISESEKSMDNIEVACDPAKTEDDARRIAELEAQLSETRNKLDKANRKVVKTLDVPQDMFEYDELNDEIFVRNEEEFDKLIDNKCMDSEDRERKKLELRNKLLHQVKHIERRKRNLSIGSIVSLESPSRRRARSPTGSPGCSPDRTGPGLKQSRLSESQLQSAS